MSERDQAIRTPSASTAAFDEQDRRRDARMTPLQRIVKALELGRRGRQLQRTLEQVRRAGPPA